jgi:murein DD-endopeptidase MepM/ murein hydrolase activator NlpD
MPSFFPIFIPLVAILALAPADLGAGSRFVQEPQLEACRLFNETLHALFDGRLDGRAARERFRALWVALKVDDVPPPRAGRWQWMFPLPGHNSSDFGESYQPDGFRFLDGPKARGFPFLRIYLRDRNRDALDDRTQRAAPVVSATEGVVVAADKFWKEEAPCPWGNYVMVLDQQTHHFFIYGHLARLRVGPGQLVDKGEVLGWLGRTGRDVAAKRLGTHLRFQVHSWDDGLFYPVYPGRALRVAGQVVWPIPEREVRPALKLPKDLPSDAILDFR